jgi:hypothetical protein
MLVSDRFIRRFEEYQGAPLTDGEKAELQRLNAVFDIKDDDIAWSAVAALMISSSMLTRAGQEARRSLETLSGLVEQSRAENERALLEAKRKIAELENATLARMEARVAKLMRPIEDRGAAVDQLYAERLTAFASRIDDAMEHVYKAGDIVTKASVLGARTVEESSTAAIADLQRVVDGFSLVVDRANLAIEQANGAVAATTRRARLFLFGAVLGGVLLLLLGIVIGSMFLNVSVTPR